MKRKNRGLTVMLALLGAALLGGLLWFHRGGQRRFSRVPEEQLPRDGKYFAISPERPQLVFREGGREEILQDIPSIHGGHFFLKGRRTVALSPRLFGRIGFHTYLYLQGRPASQEIEFSLEIERRGKRLGLRRIKAPKTSYALFQELDIRRGDRIVMEFSGRGIVCFSRPLLYERIAEPARRENIILIAADTFRGDHLGKTVPGAGPLTPNLEAFARDAVRLENAFSSTSWTLPAFMSLFTALNEYNHGVGIKSPLADDVPSLVEELSRKYATFGYHGGMVMNGNWGFARGFDFYKEFEQATPLYPEGGRSLFEKAMEILRTGQFPRLFLFLHTYQLHSPYTPPLKFLTRVNPRPEFTQLDAVNHTQPAKTYLKVDERQQGALAELYQAEILAFDSYFGGFITDLKRAGLYENSLIIFMSDHGEEFFEHGGWAHAHSLYNEALRVPLLIKFPRQRYGGRRVSDPVGIVDILPTLLSYLGMRCDSDRLDGADLMPLIRGRRQAGERTMVASMSTGRYYEFFPVRVSLISGRSKLIFNESFTPPGLEAFGEFAPPPQPAQFEFFDLAADPGETTNIASRRPKQMKKWLPLLKKIRARISRASAGTRGHRLDEETRKQLEALGYL